MGPAGRELGAAAGPGLGGLQDWGPTSCIPPRTPEASAALQVRATKDYCNNYDLTSLNVKAGDIITVRAQGRAGTVGPEHAPAAAGAGAP